MYLYVFKYIWIYIRIYTYMNDRRSGLDVCGTQNLRAIFHSFLFDIYIYTYTHILIYTYIYLRIYVYKYICVYMCIHKYEYIHTYVNNRRSGLDVYDTQNARAIFRSLLFEIHTHIYTHICVSIYMCVCIHTYIWIYTYIRKQQVQQSWRVWRSNRACYLLFLSFWYIHVYIHAYMHINTHICI